MTSVKNTHSKLIMAAAAILALAAAGTGASVAWMTDAHQADNIITVGDVSIDLTEDEWNPEEGKDLIPQAVIPKNPEVTNTGSLDAWVFLRVSIPVRNISVVNPDTQRKLPAADTELFSFEPDGNWELVSEVVSADTAEYVYGYKTTVAPGESTTELFQEVKLVNYLEGELDTEEKFVITVEAVAIQWNAERADAGLEKIYGEYLKQEETNEKEGI